MVGIQSLIDLGREIGFFDFYLPFILFFSILYGLFTKMGIFGDSNKSSGRVLNLIVSISISLLVVTFTPLGPALTEFLARFFGQSMILIVVTIAVLSMVFLGLSFFGTVTGTAPKEQIGGFLSKGIGLYAVVGGIIALVLYIFISSGGESFLGIELKPKIGNIFSSGNTAQLLAVVVVTALVALVIFLLPKLKEQFKLE